MLTYTSIRMSDRIMNKQYIYFTIIELKYACHLRESVCLFKKLLSLKCTICLARLLGC